MAKIVQPLLAKAALVVFISCWSYSVKSVESTHLNHQHNHSIVTEFELPLLSSEQKLSSNQTQKLRLSDYKGKVLYIDFWASWCGPCLVSMPLLNDLRNKYKESGFEIIAINVDKNPLLAADFLGKVNIDYPVVSDSNGNVGKQYNVTGLPSAYIINAVGDVELIHKGFKKSDIHFIEAVINKALDDI